MLRVAHVHGDQFGVTNQRQKVGGSEMNHPGRLVTEWFGRPTNPRRVGWSGWSGIYGTRRWGRHRYAARRSFSGRSHRRAGRPQHGEAAHQDPTGAQAGTPRRTSSSRSRRRAGRDGAGDVPMEIPPECWPEATGDGEVSWCVFGAGSNGGHESRKKGRVRRSRTPGSCPGVPQARDGA